MKNLMKLIAVLILLVMIGCAEDTNLVSPADSISEEIDVNKVNWINLPAQEGSLAKVHFSTSDLIVGKKGGELKIKTEYPGGPFGKVKVDSKLDFPDKSFEGEITFYQTLDPDEGTSTFGPSFVFDKPLEYTLKLEGLDLTGLNQDNINFAYLSPDGSIEIAETDGIDVDIKNGKLTVKKAKIPHFSRFGFVN